MNAGTCPLSNSARRAHEIALWAWGFMLLVLPFSTALALLFSAMGAVLSVLGLRGQLIVQALSRPVVLLALLLFAWLMLSALWSVAPRDELLEGAWKYRKLVFVFLVAASVIACQKGPEFLINFFLVGCGVVALGSLMSRFGILELILGPSPLKEGGWPIGGSIERYWLRIGGPDNPTFGRNHISQGFFLTIAAGFSLARVRWRDIGGERFRIPFFWLAIALTFLVVVFSLQGRTGYFLSAVLICLWVVWAVVHLRGRALKVTIATISIIFTVVVLQSTQLKIRTEQAFNGDQSVRMDFWKEGGRIWIESPIYGHGIGSYAEIYGNNNLNEKWIRDSRAQPHSEIVILAVQGGGVAVLLFFTILILSMRCGYDYRKFGTSGYAIVLFLVVLNSGFNSTIWDMSEGHFLVAIFALFSGNFLLSKNGIKQMGLTRND